MKKIYVDSNIFLDFWLDRMTGLKPANYYAEELFKNCIRCLYKIVISENTIIELSENFPAKNIEKKLDVFKKLSKLEIVSVQIDDLIKAKKLALDRDIPVHDAVHALIAKKLMIPLITRDKHFSQVDDLITVKAPEEL